MWTILKTVLLTLSYFTPGTYIIIGLILLILYYIFFIAEVPEIHTGNSVLKTFLIDHVSCSTTTFYPAWFGWEGRIQTAMGPMLRISAQKLLAYQRHILNLSDGGKLSLDILGEDIFKRKPASEKFVVVLLPGITSTSKTSYVKTLTLSMVNAGAIVVVMNKRGLGDFPLVTPRTFCATYHNDLAEVLDYVRESYPSTRTMAVGASFGGVLLSRFIIENPEKAKTLEAAMLISICWDPFVGTENMERPWINRCALNRYLTNNMQRLLIAQYRDIFECLSDWDIHRLLKAKTIREFDTLFTIRQFHFNSCADYYQAAQVRGNIDKFCIPVFALNACDDPIQPKHGLPLSELNCPDSMLAIILTKRGGHMGFLDSIFPVRKNCHYLERLVGQVVQAVRLYPQKLNFRKFSRESLDSDSDSTAESS